MYRLGKIDFRKEVPNGEIIEKKEETETVVDEMLDSDIDKIIIIERLRLESENNKLIKQLRNDIKNLSKTQSDVTELKEKFISNSRFVDYLIAVYKNTNTMKSIMIFWLILSILSLIGTIYMVVKIGEFFNNFSKLY